MPSCVRSCAPCAPLAHQHHRVGWRIIGFRYMPHEVPSYPDGHACERQRDAENKLHTMHVFMARHGPGVVVAAAAAAAHMMLASRVLWSFRYALTLSDKFHIVAAACPVQLGLRRTKRRRLFGVIMHAHEGLVRLLCVVNTLVNHTHTHRHKLQLKRFV